jgi:hypothetical protein
MTKVQKISNIIYGVLTGWNMSEVGLEVITKESAILKSKIKLSLCVINEVLCREDIWWSGGITPSLLTLARNGSGWSASRPSRFIPMEIVPSIHWNGVGPRTGLDAVEKRKSCPDGIEPLPSSQQPVTIPTELSRPLITTLTVQWPVFLGALLKNRYLQYY